MQQPKCILIIRCYLQKAAVKTRRGFHTAVTSEITSGHQSSPHAFSNKIKHTNQVQQKFLEDVITPGCLVLSFGGIFHSSFEGDSAGVS